MASGRVPKTTRILFFKTKRCVFYQKYFNLQDSVIKKFPFRGFDSKYLCFPGYSPEIQEKHFDHLLKNYRDPLKKSIDPAK